MTRKKNKKKINPILSPHKFHKKANKKKQISYALIVDELSELGIVFSIVSNTRVGVCIHANEQEFVSVGLGVVDILNYNGFLYACDSYECFLKYRQYLYTDDKSYIAVRVSKDNSCTHILLNYEVTSKKA